MKTSELNPILKEIEKMSCVNYAEVNHADEQVRVSIKTGRVSEFENGIHNMKDSGIWPNDLQFEYAANTKVSVIAYFDYN